MTRCRRPPERAICHGGAALPPSTLPALLHLSFFVCAVNALRKLGKNLCQMAGKKCICKDARDVTASHISSCLLSLCCMLLLISCSLSLYLIYPIMFAYNVHIFSLPVRVPFLPSFSVSITLRFVYYLSSPSYSLSLPFPLPLFSRSILPPLLPSFSPSSFLFTSSLS